MFQSLHRITRVTLLALVAALLCGTVSAEMFYMEEKKDDRIYVFAFGANYESWKNGGETGMTTITRIGEGPNGETMVFDSRDAVNLYNFKHDRPSEVFPVEKSTPSPKFTWKDGKTTFSSEYATMNLSNPIQLRYTYLKPDLGDDADRKGDSSSFRIRRAKTTLEGWIWDPNLTYKVQYALHDSANLAEDVYVDYDVSGGPGLFRVRVGQQKVPFSRQMITSSSSQSFDDRAQVVTTMATEYDQGLTLWGQLFGAKLEYWGSVMNGGARTATINDNRKMRYTGRLVYQPFGDVKYSESDFESTGMTPLVAFALAYDHNDGLSKGNSTKTDLFTKTLEADLSLKWMGLFFTAEYYDQDRTVENNDNRKWLDSSRKAWFAQAGWFVIDRHLELGARYGLIDQDTDKDDDELKEYGVVANWYFWKHALKLQTDFRVLETESKDTKDKEGRVQLQFVF